MAKTNLHSNGRSRSNSVSSAGSSGSGATMAKKKLNLTGRSRSNSVSSAVASSGPIAASCQRFTMAGLEALMVVDPRLLEGKLPDAEEVEDCRQVTEHYQFSVAVQARKRQKTLYPISGTQEVHRLRLKSGYATPSLCSEDDCSRPSSRNASRASSRPQSALDRFKNDLVPCASEAQGGHCMKDPKRTRSTLHAFAGAMVVTSA